MLTFQNTPSGTQTFLPIHHQKGLGLLVKRSPLTRAQMHRINALCKASFATLRDGISDHNYTQEQNHSMGTLSLDPKIHLDLTNKNEKSCSRQRSKMLLALVSIAFN